MHSIPIHRWLLGVAALAGCGPAGGVHEFTEACTEATNQGAALCECVGTLAAEELSEGSFDLLVASMREDDDAVNRLRGSLSLDETVATGLFLASGSARCAETLTQPDAEPG